MATKQIRDYLINFGLSENEIHLYLTLLTLGPSTIMDLSRESGIKRSTTHNNVEELINKGLVSQTTYGERRMVVAEEPEKLRFLMDQKKWEIKKMEDGLTPIIGLIEELIPNKSEYSDLEVKYYEGEKGVNSIYYEVLAASEVWSIVNVEKVLNMFPKNQDLFGQLINSKKLKLWEIAEYGESSTSQIEYLQSLDNEFYKMKLAPKGKSFFNMDMMLFNNKIAFIDFSSKEKVTGVIIHSKSIFYGLKSIFEFLWNSLE